MNIEPSAEQRAIMAHPLAPLRVAAGAGTGKTTTMALRLGHLVEHFDLEPESALGITFTNKAADELADRLRDFLPALAEDGREVEVTTYHGFAMRLLLEFGSLVGVERDAALITPGYTRELLLQSLAMGVYDYLDLSAPSHRVGELSHLSGQLADHLLIPTAVLSDDHLEPGDETPSEVLGARRELLAVLDRYREAKTALGAVDYGDLIRLSWRLVTAHPQIARRIRDRYRIVLLDEYQDTNAAQRKLLSAIFGDGFPVTAVGDPDQTIYEWRGASLENFELFPHHFAVDAATPATTIHLTENRRSDRLIVDLANRVRVNLPGDRRPLAPLPDANDGAVRTAWFHSAVDEARWLATEIRRLHDENGWRWSDMAILFRRNANIPIVRDALDAEDIPLEVASLGGLLHVPEVNDLYAWLRILGRPDDAAALMRILLGARYRLGLGDVAALRKTSHADRLLIEIIEDGDRVDRLPPETQLRLREFRDVFRKLLRDAQGVSLVELCRRILDRTDAWTEIDGMSEAGRLSARLNVYRFLDLAESWSPLEGRPSLDAFLDYLDLLQEEAAADELDTARVGGDDAVPLLTVHRSKGLEWPVVFLPAMCDGTFPSRIRAFDDPARRAASLPYERRIDIAEIPIHKKEREDYLRRRHSDQEWRTAYVAVTRAQRLLTLSGAFWYSLGVPRDPSAVYELAATLPGSHTTEFAASAGTAPAALRIDNVEDAPDPAFPEGWPAALRAAAAHPGANAPAEPAARRIYDSKVEQLQLLVTGIPERDPQPEPSGDFSTSVTGLVTYAQCPQRFFWSEIDPLPRRPTRWLRAGTELHRRIELHNRGVISLEVGEPDEDSSFEHVPGAFARFIASRFGAVKPLHVEMPFDLHLAPGRIRGRIDAIYDGEDGWEIVDFKSGQPRSEGHERLQLQAYAVAVTRAGLIDAPTSATFAYMGTDPLTEITESIDVAWMTQAEEAVESTAESAATGPWEPSPSTACHRCDFLRFCPAGQAFVDGAGAG